MKTAGLNRSGFFAALGMTRLLCLLAIGAIMVPPALAEEKSPPTAAEAEVIYPRTSEPRAETAAGGRGSGYTAVLVAALLMAGAGGWLFWRGRAAPGGVAALRKLAIAETKSLGNRQYLVVATYEDKKFLLGVCPGRIDLLTSIEAPRGPGDPRA